MRVPARSNEASSPAAARTPGGTGCRRKLSVVAERDSISRKLEARTSSSCESCDSHASRSLGGSVRASASSASMRCHTRGSRPCGEAISPLHDAREQQPCPLPFAPDRAPARSERRADLLVTEPEEVAHLHYLGEPRVHLGKEVQGAVHLEDLILRGPELRGSLGAQRHVHHVASVPLGSPAANRIHHDRA